MTVAWSDRAVRVVYSSSPDRGLDVLLGLWPRVREQVSEAAFSFCYSEVYDAVADQDPTIAEFRDRVRVLADQDGVVPLGSLSQPALADLMCHSRVWVHPSWASLQGEPFHETSCIGAMEAQAAGCHVVASDWGALRETVQVGARINGGALSDAWKDAFVAEIVAGLTDRKVGDHATTAGPEHAQSLGWEDVAVQIGQLVAANDPSPGAGKAPAQVGESGS
jgi:glycosyltransferase involved in cell wall biosynthesis